VTYEPRLFAVPIQSVIQGDNGQLIRQVWDLLGIHDDAVVLDATYGLGNFWTDVRPAKLIAHDLDPLKGDGVDCRALPEDDASVDVFVLDLPYVIQGGRETSTIPGMLDAYGLNDGPRSKRDLFANHHQAMREARRVLRPGGWLLVKCADAVSSGRRVWLRDFVVDIGRALGFTKYDELVHYSRTGPQPNDDREQKHARRAHSFLVIFHAATTGV
jgi:hypothetical protein